MPPLAIAAIKQILANGADLPLPEALTLENQAFLRLFDTQDQKEGMAAFLEKRKPDFKGV
jgi:enoyl-CoA hydratase/carnithine racemase